jgi:hypothetical protein
MSLRRRAAASFGSCSGVEVWSKKKGRCGARPRGYAGELLTLLIALLLIEPVFRSGQALRPVIQMEIPPPGFDIGPILVLRRTPWEISSSFPWQPIVLAHRSSNCGSAPHHAAPSPEMPCRDTLFRRLGVKVASRGPARPGPTSGATSIGNGTELRGGLCHG